jgi:hypothetical protein
VTQSMNTANTLRNCQSSIIIHVLYMYLYTMMHKKTCTQYAKLVAHCYAFKPLFIYGVVWIGKIINKQTLMGSTNTRWWYTQQKIILSVVCVFYAIMVSQCQNRWVEDGSVETMAHNIMQSGKRDSKQLTRTGTWGNKIKGPFWTVTSL